MGRATNKNELLENASMPWDKLWAMINGMTDEEQKGGISLNTL